MKWNFNQDNYNQENYSLINQGNHRVRIADVKETMAQNGTEGLEITLEVNGYENRLKHFIWYNRDRAAMTDRKLGELFESFDITGDARKSCEAWVGKMGAVHVVHDEYRGHMIAKVKCCLKRDVQVKLSAWRDNNLLTSDPRVWTEQNAMATSKRPFSVSNGSRNVVTPSQVFDGFNMKF